MELYHTKLHTHARLTRYHGHITEANISSELLNPSCGDSICFTGKVEDSTLKQIAFTGKGCVISQATASILSEFCLEKSCTTILKLTEEDLIQLIEMQLGPLRIQCALLSLNALKKALLTYQAYTIGQNVRPAESNPGSQQP
jgi:nitrogen fixation NifU-like protein